MAGSYAARTMRWGGVIIVLFVVYHILDLTTRHLNPVKEVPRAHDAVAADFDPSRWYVTACYATAVIAVGFHVRHGIWSALHTLGAVGPRARRAAQAAAAGIAVVLCAGFLSVPFAVTIGLVG